MGAADTLFTATGSPLDTFRSMVPYHENSVTEARNRIGDRVFQTAFDHGRALTLDDAAARAERATARWITEIGGRRSAASAGAAGGRTRRTGPDQPSTRGPAGNFSARSDERRVGKGGVSTCRSRW